MAGDSVEFRVVVNAQGLVTGLKQVTNFGNETQKTGKKAKVAGDEVEQLNYRMNQGVVGASSAARSFSKLNQTIGQGNSGLVASYATLAANAFAVSAAFNALREAAQVEQLLQGLEVQGAKTGRTLTTVASSIQEITEGSISAADAMRAAALGSSAGLTAGDLEKLTQVATNASKVLGRNLPDSMDRIIKGVTKLEPELLDELGLMTKLTEASEIYARQVGKSAAALTNFEKRRAFVEAIQREGELKFGGIEGQVDVNQFDRLAASFQNLTQATLSWVSSSSAIGFILDNLTGTVTGLIGAVLLFGSTIRKQLLGTFTEASAVASNSAKEALKEANKLKTASQENLQSSKALLNATKQDAKTAIELTNKVPAGYKQIVDTIQSGGKVTAEQFEKATDSLERSSNRYKGIVKGLAKTNTEEAAAARAAAQEQIAANTLRIQNLEDYKEAQKTLQATEVTNRQEALKARAAQNIAAREQQTANALTAASNLNVKEAFKANLAASKAYSIELRSLRVAQLAANDSTAAAGPKMAGLRASLDALKVSAFSAGLAFKTLGVAFVSILPWAGAAFAAFSLLEMAYDKFFVTDADRAKKKAFEELEEVLNSTIAKNKEYIRVLEAEAQVGQKTLQANIIRANSLKELAEAYIKTSDEALKAELLERRIAESRAQLQGGPEVVTRVRQIDVAEAAGIDPDDPALKNALKLVEGSFLGLGATFKSFNQDQINALKAINQLTSASPELAKAFAQKTGSIKTFSEFTKVSTELLIPFSKEQGVLADSLGNLQSQLQATDQAFANFSRSLKPTTPYDQMAEGLIGLNQALEQVNRSMQKSGLSAEVAKQSFDNIVTGIGENITSRLTPATQLLLRSFNSIGSEIDALTKARDMATLVGDTAKVAELQRQIQVLEGSRSGIRQTLSSEVQKELKSTEALVLKTQEQEITLQSSLALQQANLAVIQRRGIITAADVEKQINAQNAIVAAQIEQLKNKLSLAKAELNSLEVSKQQLAIQKELIDTIKGQTVAQQETALRGGLQTATDPNQRAAIKGLIDRLARTKTPLDPDQIDVVLNQTEKAFRLQKAGVKQLETSIQATSKSILTSAEKESQKEQASIANQRTANALVQENLNVRTSNEQIEARLQDLRSGGLNTLTLELKAIDKNAKRRKEQLESEQKLQLADLERQRRLAEATGNTSQEKYFSDLINKTKVLNQAQLENVDLAAREEKLNKIGIKNAADALQIVQQSMELYQRRADLAREVADQESQIARNAAEIRIMGAGGQVDERTRLAFEAEAAQVSLRAAEEQFDLRMQAIDVEFKLLEAQRQQTVANLTAQEAALRQLGQYDLANTVASARGNLERADLTAIRSLQERQARNTVTIAKQAAEKAGLAFNNSLRPEAFGLSAATNLAERLKSRRRAAAPGTTGLPLSASAGEEAPLQSNAKPFENVKLSFMEVMDVVNTGVAISMQQFELLSSQMSERLGQDFGPEGKVLQAIARAMETLPQVFSVVKESIDKISEAMNRMGESTTKSMELVQTSTQKVGEAQNSSKEGFKSMMQVASAAFSAIASGIAAIGSLLKASSDLKIARIDREIAAEQKRDGKSAESITKLQGLEKRKEDLARKSFKTQKALMIAQAVMGTAAGIASALSLGIVGIPLAAIIGAMGAAQIAIISGMQYDGGAKTASQPPSTLSIGRRSDTVDLARGPSANAGGEAGFIRGSQGMGTNASNYRTIGSAYGGDLMRGYGNRGFVVGEKGPEIITPETPINVTPANETMGATPVNATFNIQALDASGVQDILVSQKGNIIAMIRQAANASGQGFLEEVNTNIYTRPQTQRL